MKKVQFLFFVSILYLSVNAQQRNTPQEYDFARLFSPAYRNYIKKSHENFIDNSVTTFSLKTFRYGGKFSSLNNNPIPTTKYFFTPDYRHPKTFTLELLQSDFIGTVIQSVIQEQQVR